MNNRVQGLLLLAAASLCGAVSAESEQTGPESVCAKAQTAINENDWKTVTQCLTPETRDQAAFWLCVTAGLSTEGEAEEQMEARWDALEQVMKKHNMDDDRCDELGFDKMSLEEVVVAFATHVEDPDQLIVDVIGVLQDHGGLDEPVFIFENLADIEIDGDVATATVQRRSDEDPVVVPIRFRRIQDEWRIETFVFPESNRFAKPIETP